MGKTKIISKLEYALFGVVGVFILLFFNNCGGFTSAQNHSLDLFSNTSGVGFKCSDPNLSSESRTFILTKKQYENSLEELFGTAVLNVATAVISTLPNVSNDTDTQERISSLSATEVQAFANVAEVISNYIVSNNNETSRIFGTCANQSNPDATCVETYLNNFAPRILGRPLSVDETNFAQTLMGQPGSYKENLKALLSYHLQSPYFIWGIELGNDTINSDNTVSLRPYEIARRISLATTDSIPDQELFDAARTGQLSSKSQIESQVRRLLTTNRAKEKLVNILLRWSLSDNVKDLSNLPDDLRGNLDTNGLEVAMLAEAKAYIEHIVFDQQGSFQDILTSKASFAQHPGLASIYQHAPSAAGNPEQMGGRRQGLLLRAPSLTWFTERTSIIHRGVDFQKKILCNQIPSPNVDISNIRNENALSDAEKLNFNNRDIVAHQTQSPVCMACHSIINPTGFAFEGFDSFGRIRSQELIFDEQGSLHDNLSIDTNAQIPLPNNESITVNDAYELVDYVATSPQGSACFSRNLFRFIYEKKESERDGCQLTKTFQIVFNSELSVLDAMAEMIASDYISKKYLE